MNESQRELLANLLTSRPELFEQRGGIWAIAGEHALVPRLPLSGRLDLWGDDVDVKDQEHGYALSPDGVAVIDIVGAVSKFATFWRFLGLSAQPTLGEIEASVRKATADPNVLGIMLRVDSPGGTMWGTPELAQAVQDAAALKPVHAYAVDQCCSAAYWIASQAGRFTSNAGAEVGSIGTYCLLVDSSERAAELGLKFIRIRTGQHKGVGVPGVEITEAEIKELQRWIDSANSLFLSAVKAGRPGLASSLEKLADGRFWMGGEAATLGLTDGVETFDAAMEELRTAVRARGGKDTTQEGSEMAEGKPTPAATAAGTIGGVSSQPATPQDLATLQARLAELEAKNTTQATALAAAQQRELEATVDRDLGALSDSVPPAVLQDANTRELLIDLKSNGKPGQYEAALGLVAKADASAVLGEAVGGAVGGKSELKRGVAASTVFEQLKAAGMTEDEIKAHAAKTGVDIN